MSRSYTARFAHPAARVVRLGAAVFALAAAYPGAALAEGCPAHITAPGWAQALRGGQQAQAAFLDRLKACVPGNAALQQEVDDLAVYSLDALPRTDAGLRQAQADFTVHALQINAEAGFASSQHNYAAVHNADPNGWVRLFVRQDMPTFIYWTRKAAAQKEPRALFNLAVRMASSTPPAGIVQDFATAYLIFSYLERNHTGLPPAVMAYVGKAKARAAAQLAPEEVRQLDAAEKSFDFATLGQTATAVASFDCSKSARRVEKLICADAMLPELDSDVAHAYSALLLQQQDRKSRGRARAGQKHWLNTVRDACRDTACLRRAYLARLDALQAEAAPQAAESADEAGGQGRPLYEVRCDHARGELVVSGPDGAPDSDAAPGADAVPGRDAASGADAAPGAGTGADSQVERYSIDPDTLTEVSGTEMAMLHTEARQHVSYCQLGKSWYKVVVAPHVENANPNGECGAADTDLALTVLRNGATLMSGLEFHHCRVSDDAGKTVSAVAFSETAGTVKVSALANEVFLPVNYVMTFSLRAPPADWMAAIFDGYPAEDANAALLLAVYRLDVAAVRQALEKGANPNATDLEGEPPLAILNAYNWSRDYSMPADVRRRHRIEIATLLFAAGASANAEVRGGNSVLATLVDAELPEEIADMALAHGADVRKGYPLFAAMQAGRAELGRKFLDRGADPDQKLKSGTTALWTAATAGFYNDSRRSPRTIEDYASCVRLLLKRGASIKAATSDARGLPVALVETFGRDKRLPVILAELVPYLSQEELARTEASAERYSDTLAQWLKARMTAR